MTPLDYLIAAAAFECWHSGRSVYYSSHVGLALDVVARRRYL